MPEIFPETSPGNFTWDEEMGQWVMTVFHNYQWDLDYSNPTVFIEMLDVILFWANQGADILRLDAVAFLWKKIGTTCLHLPQTHAAVKLLRVMMETINPQSIVLTETNVPNEENLSYFGDQDEAHMVYQFSLPPLLLHALFTGNSTWLTQWAQTIPDQSPYGTYFKWK